MSQSQQLHPLRKINNDTEEKIHALSVLENLLPKEQYEKLLNNTYKQYYQTLRIYFTTQQEEKKIDFADRSVP